MGMLFFLHPMPKPTQRALRVSSGYCPPWRGFM